MIAFLEASGLLRIDARMAADLSPLVVTGAALTLTLGMVLAWRIL
jgi:hypothetical protein